MAASDRRALNGWRERVRTNWDMSRLTHLAAGLSGDGRQGSTPMLSETVLEMATPGTAPDRARKTATGLLEPGSRADIVLPDRDRPKWCQFESGEHAGVGVSDGRAVDTVLVDGQSW